MKIFAIGMNYAAHTRELHNFLKTTDVQNPSIDSLSDSDVRKPSLQTSERPGPVVFTKADSALLNQGKPFFIPDHLGRIDYEAELVVRICRLGKNIPERFAHRYYDALTVGIDFTARDLQRQASAAGHPWTICKGFDGSAAIGEWVPKEKVLTQPDATAMESGLQQLQFHLDITTDEDRRQGRGATTVQEGRTSDMVYTVDEMISYISRFFTLKTGDLLYTGTPVGVGPVSIGDHLEGYLGERKVLDFFCR